MLKEYQWKNSLGPGLNRQSSLFQGDALPVTPPRALAICSINIGHVVRDQAEQKFKLIWI